jgi:hypothetical protein
MLKWSTGPNPATTRDKGGRSAPLLRMSDLRRPAGESRRMTTARMPRVGARNLFVLFVASAAGVLLMAPGSATASTVSLYVYCHYKSQDECHYPTAVVRAHPGEVNDVSVRAPDVGGTIVVTDRTAPLHVSSGSPGCTAIDEHSVRCHDDQTFHDFPYGRWRTEIYLGDRNDRASTEPWAEVYAGSGNDAVVITEGRARGESGDDVLHSRKILRSGTVGDPSVPFRYLYGGTGDDRLLGDAGYDGMNGGPGNDYLQGAAGPDTLKGSSGSDRLDGGGGPDRLYGAQGSDRLEGGGGPDLLYGGQGRDLLNGGPGADSLHSVDAFSDRVRCGPDADRAVVDRVDRYAQCERVRMRRLRRSG